MASITYEYIGVSQILGSTRLGCLQSLRLCMPIYIFIVNYMYRYAWLCMYIYIVDWIKSPKSPFRLNNNLSLFYCFVGFNEEFHGLFYIILGLCMSFKTYKSTRAQSCPRQPLAMIDFSCTQHSETDCIWFKLVMCPNELRHVSEYIQSRLWIHVILCPNQFSHVSESS